MKRKAALRLTEFELEID